MNLQQQLLKEQSFFLLTLIGVQHVLVIPDTNRAGPYLCSSTFLFIFTSNHPFPSNLKFYHFLETSCSPKCKSPLPPLSLHSTSPGLSLRHLSLLCLLWSHMFLSLSLIYTCHEDRVSVCIIIFPSCHSLYVDIHNTFSLSF